MGSLTPGKLGDVVVLDADLEQTRPENFGEVHVTTTVLDGRIVHQRRPSGRGGVRGPGQVRRYSTGVTSAISDQASPSRFW
ncbi:hypothetical protein [Amycolatopsis echigonensis]|nr:hypothetical protein [Amycolatopsis echigonensis]